MNDQELREMIRASIARHAEEKGYGPFSAGRDGKGAVPLFLAHASHAMLPLARGGDGDGACLIEPAVRCTHCGYCVSYGH